MIRRFDNWIWACPALAIAVGAAAVWLWGWSWPNALLVALLLACPALAMWCAVQLRGSPDSEGDKNDIRKG